MTKKIANKVKFHYAWLILVTCCVFYAMTMGALTNCQGIFHTAIYQNMGWKYSDYCISTIFNGLCAAVALLFAGKVFERFPIKAVLTAAVLVFGAGYALRGAMHSIAGFCFIYAIIGIASALILYVPVPMLLNAWFVKKKHLALSVAMMSSGIGGMVFNPVLSSIIETRGWRLASFVNGGIAIAATLPFILLFAVKDPSDIGLNPYGASETGTEKKPDSNSSQKNDKNIQVANNRRTMTVAFVLAGLVSFISFLPQQLSNYAATRGFAASVGAMMVSFAMAGNISSKLLIGIVVDKLGAGKTFVWNMLLVIGAMAVLLFNPNVIAVLYAASFVTGIVCANNVLLPPVAVETFSDSDSYPFNLARTNTATMIMSAFSIFIGGWLFDLAGDSSLLLEALIVLQVVCIFLTSCIFSNKSNINKGTGR